MPGCEEAAPHPDAQISSAFDYGRSTWRNGIIGALRTKASSDGQTAVMALVHFTAQWAERICGPHRTQVAEAARQLGMRVTECDVDSGSDLVEEHHPLNVPAVAIQGKVGSLVVGAFPADALVKRLHPFVGTAT
jgi:hypothetical protein